MSTTAAGGVQGGGLTGQDHDRIDGAIYTADPEVAAEDVEPEITVGQKMLSAVSGSILTSILVTPLDVVRVRLQSQPSPSPASSRPNPSFPYPRSFTNLPPDLGVTACCKNVFWVNNNTPYCVADASLSTASASGPVSTLPIASSSQTSQIHAETCVVAETERRTINSTLDGIRKIARNEGVTTLWRGLSPTLLMAVPGNVIYFAGYDWLRTSVHSPLRFSPDSPLHISDKYTPLIAGSSARVMAALVVSPIELFRTRMQAASSPGDASTSNFRQTFDGVKEMVQTQGVRTLWRGLSLTLWRDVPFSALYWKGYEVTKAILGDMRERRDRGRGLDVDEPRIRSTSRERARNHTATLIDSFIAGAVSGGVASFVTTPFDVGKTRRQVYLHSGDSKAAAEAARSAASGVLRPEDRSMPRFLWHIFKEEGVAGLFKGVVPRIAKVAPACAIMISSYEMGKKMARDGNREELKG